MKTHCSLTMLFRKINCKFVKNLSCVATKCTKQSSITIHDNEAKFVIICKKSIQCLKRGKKINHEVHVESNSESDHYSL